MLTCSQSGCDFQVTEPFYLALHGKLAHTTLSVSQTCSFLGQIVDNLITGEGPVLNVNVDLQKLRTDLPSRPISVHLYYIGSGFNMSLGSV